MPTGKRPTRVCRPFEVKEIWWPDVSNAGISRRESSCKRQVGASGIAADGEPCRIDAQPMPLARGETDHRDHLVKGHRKPILRRQPIIDGQRGDAALADELAQHRIPARQAALHKAAAMRVDNG